MSGTVQSSAGGEAAARDAQLHASLRRLQVQLNFASVRVNAFSVPAWSIVLNTMFLGFVPDIGYTPLSTSWVWVAACCGVAVIAQTFSRGFQRASADGEFETEFWYARVIMLHLSIGLSWAIGIAVHWQPENVANHLFLFVITMGVAALYAVVRAGDVRVVFVGTAPVLATLWFHFLQQSLWIDMFLSVLLPLWSIQFYRDARRGSAAILQSHVTRLEMETLAQDLKNARDEAEHQRAGAVRANASKSTFLANMSHELRTPLNAILGFSEIISSQALGPEAQERYRDYASDIQNSGRHLLSLINDILDIAKIEAGKLELDRQWLNGGEVIAHVAKIVQDRAGERGLALNVTIEPADLKFYADERAFRQIALNLLTNAIKFTDKGSVSVTLSRAPSASRLTVEDTGCGIPQDQIDRVFEPFEQVDNRYARASGGTGLGLTLVRALAELHGGTCKIASREGVGTRVEITLPDAYGNAAPNWGRTTAAA